MGRPRVAAGGEDGQHGVKRGELHVACPMRPHGLEQSISQVRSMCASLLLVFTLKRGIIVVIVSVNVTIVITTTTDTDIVILNSYSS